jgi:hypothetical protein
LAPSMLFSTAVSSNWPTWRVLSSDRRIGITCGSEPDAKCPRNYGRER